MIKVFLKHLIYEKCITIIFDGITKAFKQPVRRYEIINVEKITEKGFSKEIYTVKYNGELHTIVSDNLPQEIREQLEAFSESQGIELPWEIKNNDTFKSE